MDSLVIVQKQNWRNTHGYKAVGTVQNISEYNQTNDRPVALQTFLSHYRKPQAALTLRRNKSTKIRQVSWQGEFKTASLRRCISVRDPFNVYILLTNSTHSTWPVQCAYCWQRAHKLAYYAEQNYFLSLISSELFDNFYAWWKILPEYTEQDPRRQSSSSTMMLKCNGLVPTY